MPPRRSQRNKRPSVEALEALATSPPRQSRGLGSSGTSSLVEVPLVPVEPHQLESQSTGCSSSSSSSAPVAPSNPVSCDDVTSSFLPQAVLDQLVSRVTTEVTRQLQPVLAQVTSLPSQFPNCAQPAQASTPGPSTAHPSGGYTTNIQDVVEVPAVQEGVQSVLGSFSVGDFQTPGTSFHAPSSHSDTSPCAASQLATIASNLLRSSLQPSFLPVYQRYVSQMLKGFHKVGFRLDGRLPITLPILDQLFLVAPYLTWERILAGTRMLIA
ncbi:uncharacterized protein [Montipora capricornis]|uniref:uncharacterized protein isoform X2 n=1 Tax=Montipora capricornis TaxID=246305 RepID=UPI0035F1F38D